MREPHKLTLAIVLISLLALLIPASVAVERNALPVGRPRGPTVVAIRIGHTNCVSITYARDGVKAHDIDRAGSQSPLTGDGVAQGDKGDVLSVGRPDWGQVIGPGIGQVHQTRAIRRCGKDLIVSKLAALGLKGNPP